MTIKKSLLAVATASTVAIAGAGVASATEDDLPAPDVTLSADNSLEGVDLSDQAGQVFGSVADGTWDLGTGIDGLAALVAAGGAVAGSIMLLPSLDGAIKDFQSWASQYIPQ
ncbi:hypothetical protein [Corynebacterium variabile]|uniref:hypothetical protein n=1 Tax=Corynebacterium variabile TaxID=1727 RepID=UPI003736B835